MTTTRLQEENVRRRVVTDLGTTFLVEAGAGTGKTTVLVQRLLAIVRGGRGELDRLAAITFTEKAAAELRARLHFEIETALLGALSESERQHLREARRQFDRAQISTVHAFCANLLRERPVEACVDPNFSVLNAFEASLLHHELWREWLAQEMERSPEALKQALRANISLDHVETLRDFLLEHRDSLPLLPAPVEDQLTEFSRSFIRDIGRLAECARACADRTDRAYAQVVALSELLTTVHDRASWERLLLSDIPLSAKTGAKGNWQPAKALEEARQLFRALAEEHAQARAAWTHNLTVSLALWLQGYLNAYEQKKRERACLDFVDLLLLTRNLLRRDVNVRRYFQRRFRFLLVDEFQDTDPLQAEIIFFLAEREPRAGEWTEVTLQPGKLFLVGDPQQSIYRFRRADLQVYARVGAIIARQGEAVSLSTNFRTRVPALTWINETFAREFSTVSGTPPAYRPLTEARTESTGREVIVLPVPAVNQLNREERRQAEARSVAAFLAGSVGEIGLEMWGGRSIDYRDVAILCRTHQTLEAYEEGLREAGIPHWVVGGRRYAHRQEIEEMHALLRAIESPSDTVALVATLRSSLFGFSDEELATFMSDGGRLDYTDVLPAPVANALTERFTAAYTLLREFHTRHTYLSPAAFLAELYAQTHLLPLFALHHQGNQRVANLLRLIETARALADQGQSTLAALNRFLEFQEETALEENAPFLEEHESAVRLLTIHQAKGLEFPVVILADAPYSSRRASRPGIIERLGGQLELRAGPRDLMCATLGWRKAESQEQDREAAEERRLWYVAATRVRDHLIIPVVLPGEGTAKKTEHWAVTDELLLRLTSSQGEINGQERGVFIYRPQPHALQPMALPISAPSLFQVERNEATLHDYHEWESARRATLVSGRQAEAVATVTALTAADSSQEFSVGAGLKAREGERLAGLRFRRAMHAALRSASVPGTVRPPIVRLPGLWNPEGKEEMERLAAATLTSPVMLRARNAKGRFAETPFALLLSGRLVEGVIDFAFLENGAWVIVDFKTDGVAETEVEKQAAAYRSQLCLCALALERLTDHPVTELVLFFIRPQQAVTFSWGDEGRHLAETLVTAPPSAREADG